MGFVQILCENSLNAIHVLDGGAAKSTLKSINIWLTSAITEGATFVRMAVLRLTFKLCASIPLNW
jgi:hypothetical protein